MLMLVGGLVTLVAMEAPLTIGFWILAVSIGLLDIGTVLREVKSLWLAD
jgi:hypothetical protein